MELINLLYKKKIGGNGLGAKRLGLGGETTRGPKRGRNDQGGNVLGAKRLVTQIIFLFIFISSGIIEPIPITLKMDYCFNIVYGASQTTVLYMKRVSVFHIFLCVCSLFSNATFQIFIYHSLDRFCRCQIEDVCHILPKNRLRQFMHGIY